MAVNGKLRDALAIVLQDDETVVESTFAQLKQGNSAKRLAKDMGVSLAISAALTATGFGVMRNTMPPQVWVVVTPKRLLMFEKPDGHRSLGPLVFDARLDAVTVTDASQVFGTVVLTDAGSGDNIARLNFGARRSAARRVVASTSAH